MSNIDPQTLSHMYSLVISRPCSIWTATNARFILQYYKEDLKPHQVERCKEMFLRGKLVE